MKTTFTNPTPTPWYAAHWTRHAASTVLINDTSTLTGKRMVADCETEADATFIVQACNSHGLLLAALERARESMLRSHCNLPAIRQIQAALDAAGAA
jgi:hypothetical protein